MKKFKLSIWMLKCGAKFTTKSWWRFDKVANIQAFKFWCGCTINTLPLWEYLMNSKSIVWMESQSHEKKCKNMMFVLLSYLVPFTLVVMLSNEHHEENEHRVLQRSFNNLFLLGLASKKNWLFTKNYTHYLNSMMITQWFNVGIGCISGLFNSCCISFIFCYISHIKEWFYGYKKNWKKLEFVFSVNSKIKPNKWKTNHQSFGTTKLKKNLIVSIIN